MSGGILDRRAALAGAGALGAGLLLAPAAIARSATTGRVRVDGIDLYYEVHGKQARGAVPLMLLQGGATTIESAFSPALVARLSRDRPLILMEQQGHGHTADRPDRPFSLDRMVDDTIGVLAHLGIARADLMGHSLGGMIVTGVSIRRPDLARSITTLGTPYRLEGFRTDLVALQRGQTSEPSPELARLLPTDAEMAGWRASHRRSAPDPESFDRILERLNAMLATWPGWPRADLASIRVPTLIAIGDNDYVRIDHAAEMAKLIPNARLAVLPGATHLDLMRHEDWIALLARTAAA